MYTKNSLCVAGFKGEIKGWRKFVIFFEGVVSLRKEISSQPHRQHYDYDYYYDYYTSALLLSTTAWWRRL